MTLVRTAVDAWANEAAPAKNFGTVVRLWLNGGATGNDRQAFLHFARPFPIGAVIIDARLRVRTRGAWAGSQVVTAKRITAKWSETRLNWNNRPAVVATNSAGVTVASAAAGALVELNVTAMLQDVANGGAFFGFRLELDTNVDRALHSAEAVTASLRPQLEVTYVIPPDVPTSLAPSGARAVTLAKPRLSWVFSDRDVGGSQSSSQVQVDDAVDFATPEYDSGKIANTLQAWDLAATAYAGVPADATRYWRVRVWDETDQASAWADPVSFVRTSKGTLTLTSPGAITADLTPPVSWTLTGRTQEAYRVILRHLPAVGASVDLWDTGKVTSTDTSVTVPAGLVKSGQTYEVIVRVYDTVDRQAIAGDPDYSEATQAFSYTRSGVPAAVTALTASLPVANGPGVQLDWSRAAQPDYFALKVNGVEVEPRIEPTDVFVSGTSYRMTYFGATPRVAGTYEVEAVVDSAGVLQHSGGNATDTETSDPDGIWLVDPEDGAAVRIAGQDSPDFDIGESAAVHYLSGRRAPVTITDTVRGYEGRVSGLLRGKTDRNTFLALKGRLKPLRLIISDVNIAIELGPVSAPPTPLSEDRLFECSFDFVQVGDFTFDVAGG